MIESWKKRLGLNARERLALSAFSIASINNIISDIHKAEAFEVKNDLLQLGEFFVVLAGIEERLDGVLSRVCRLGDLPEYKKSNLKEQLNYLKQLHEYGMPKGIGLESLNYDLDKFLEVGNQLVTFRQRIGSGEVSMHDTNGSWSLPSKSMEELKKATFNCIDLNGMLRTLQDNVRYDVEMKDEAPFPKLRNKNKSSVFINVILLFFAIIGLVWYLY